MHATIEAGRAEYGANDALRSGFGAWLRGVRLVARDPLRTMGAYFGATLASFVIAVPLLVMRLQISGPGVGALVVGFVLTQLGVASLGWGRAARLFALTAIARSHSPAIAVPSDGSEDAPGDGYTVP